MLIKNRSSESTRLHIRLKVRENVAASFSSSNQVRNEKQIENTKKLQKSKQIQKYNDSWWTLEENLAYAEFLKQNLHLFEKTREEKRLMKINVLISRHVKTRSSDQCRSHHQKMLKYHSSICQIIDYVLSLKSTISNEENQQILRKVQEIPIQPSVLFRDPEINQVDFAYLPPLDFFDNVLFQNQTEFLG